MKLYLFAVPDAPDAKAVKNIIYEIEYRQEKETKEVAEKSEKKVPQIDVSGIWKDVNMPSCWKYKFIIEGQELVITTFCEGSREGTVVWGTGRLDGRNFEGSSPGVNLLSGGGLPPKRFKGTISNDNNTITLSEIVEPSLARTSEARRIAEMFRSQWVTMTLKQTR